MWNSYCKGGRQKNHNQRVGGGAKKATFFRQNIKNIQHGKNVLIGEKYEQVYIDRY